MGSLNSNEKRLVVKAKGNAAYAAPGYLIFYRDQTLFAQHFDNKKLELTGEAVPLLTDVQFFPRISEAVFSASSAVCWWPNETRIPGPRKCCGLTGKASRLASR